MNMRLDNHNILWYYTRVIVFCALPFGVWQPAALHIFVWFVVSQWYFRAICMGVLLAFLFLGKLFPVIARMTLVCVSANASL